MKPVRFINHIDLLSHKIRKLGQLPTYDKVYDGKVRRGDDSLMYKFAYHS